MSETYSLDHIDVSSVAEDNRLRLTYSSYLLSNTFLSLHLRSLEYATFNVFAVAIIAQLLLKSYRVVIHEHAQVLLSLSLSLICNSKVISE